jgi:tRNA A-37 threonylcarbamoyl transferase component Bud32
VGGARPLQIGRYLLHDELASGGMASVHFGRLVGTGGFAKTVAIKRLHRHFARQDSFRKMILEEGRLAARIRHPNVVPPLDVLAEGSELLLVMEYVHGESLSRLIKAATAAHEKIPLAVAAAIMANVLHGLHAAHEARDESGEPLGIVHRDISPQNILVGVDGVARVIDFGIAKAVDTDEHTQTGTIKGKVPYLAPEQLDGEQATRRTDVYAASVVFWEALTGKRLFEGADESEILRNIMTMVVPPPSSLNPAVPPSIDEVILRGLARRPADRPATARDMALEVEGAVHLATATQVGAWVERLAATALATRAELLAEVEQSGDGEGEDAPTEMMARPTPRAAEAVRGAPPTLGGPPALGTADMLPAPPPPSRRMAEPAPVITHTARLEDTPRPPPAGALRKPEVEIPNVAWLPPPSPDAARAEAQSGSRFVPWAIGLVVLLLVSGWLALPFAIHRAVIKAAAARGVTLSIDRVEVSRGSVRLVDVRAESPEVPGVSVHAGSILVAMRHLSPERATIDDVDATLDGPWTEVVRKLTKWRAAHGASVMQPFAEYTQIAVTSARVEWKTPVGADTSLLLENLSGDITKNSPRLFGDDWRFSAPLVTLRLGTVSAGPWALDADRIGIADRAILRFDPSGTYPATVTWSVADDGSDSVDFAIPPTRLADVHVPPALLGTFATEHTRVEARGAVSIVTVQSSHTAGGKLTLAAGGLSVFSGPDRVDVALEIPVSGDTSTPISISSATLAIAPSDASGVPSAPAATARLVGQMDLSGKGVRLELAGKTNALPCAKGPGQTSVIAVIAVPIHDLRDAHIGLTPSNACPPRLR